MLEKIKESSRFLSPFLKEKHYPIGIILGSGLGNLGELMNIEHAIPYVEIPHFPVSTVEGHQGRLLIGQFGNKNVIAMQGRFHYYEGYHMQEVTFPVRVMHALGVNILFVSNAAGGVNTSYQTGDLMIIRDHINLFPEHPLRGKNIDELGPRFPAMTDAYSPRLIQLAEPAFKAPLSKLQPNTIGYESSEGTPSACPPCQKLSSHATWTWSASESPSSPIAPLTPIP